MVYSMLKMKSTIVMTINCAKQEASPCEHTVKGAEHIRDRMFTTAISRKKFRNWRAVTKVYKCFHLPAVHKKKRSRVQRNVREKCQ